MQNCSNMVCRIHTASAVNSCFVKHQQVHNNHHVEAMQLYIAVKLTGCDYNIKSACPPPVALCCHKCRYHYMLLLELGCLPRACKALSLNQILFYFCNNNLTKLCVV